MNKKLTAIIFAFLCLFTINQAIDLTSQINVDKLTEPEIESVPTDNVNAAHITEPTTAPIVHEYKDDFPPINKGAIIYDSKSVIYYSYPAIPPDLIESDGFLTAKKYQSSYLI